MDNFRELPPDILRLLLREAGLDPSDFGKKAEDVWEKGKGESDPAADFHFVFRQHSGPESAERVAKLLPEYDVFIPEAIGWDKSKLEMLRSLSSGKLPVASVLKDMGLSPQDRDYERRKKELERLYASNKAVAMVDVSNSDPLFDRMERNRKNYGFPALLSGSYEEALAYVGRTMQEFTASQQERESLILKQIPLALREVTASYPNLKQKSRLKILVELGTGHSPVYRALKEGKNQATSEFVPKGNILFHFRDEGMRRYQFGKEVNDDFLAKAVLEKLIYSNWALLEPILGASFEVVDARKYINAFSPEEIKALFEKAKASGQKFVEAFISASKEKQLLPPVSA